MIYKIELFQIGHLTNFVFRDEDIYSLKYMDDYEDHIIIFLKKNLTFTLSYQNKTIFIVSFNKLWPGVFEIWGVVNKQYLYNYFSIFRYARYILNDFVKNFNVHRLQCQVRKEFYKSHRMMKFLDFKKEAVLYNYGPFKETYIQYSRLIYG